MSEINQTNRFTKGLQDVRLFFNNPTNHTEKKDNLISIKETQDAIKNSNLSIEGQAFLKAIIENTNLQTQIKNIEPFDKTPWWGLKTHIYNHEEISKHDLETLEKFTDGNSNNDTNSFRIVDNRTGSATPVNKDTDRLAESIKTNIQNYMDKTLPSNKKDDENKKTIQKQLIKELQSIILTNKKGKFINEFSDQEVETINKALDSIGIKTLIKNGIVPTKAGKKQDVVNRLMIMLDIKNEFNISIGPKTLGALINKMEIPPEEESQPKIEYTIKGGDTLSEIAKKYKISLQALLAANTNITDPDKIKIGQIITIPLKN